MKPRQSRGRTAERWGGVDILKYIITSCGVTPAFVRSHAGGCSSQHVYTHVESAGTSHMHARSNAAKLYPSSHLNCRACSISLHRGTEPDHRHHTDCSPWSSGLSTFPPRFTMCRKPTNGKQWFESVWRFADSSEHPLCLS